MQSPREVIYQALFAAGAGAMVGDAPAFRTTSRRLRHWSQVAEEEQPAFFQVQRREQPRSKEHVGLPANYILRVDWVVYVNTGSLETVIPSQLLNPILDALEATLPPVRFGPGGAVTGIPNQTLGVRGVIEARILDEEILVDEDVTGAQAFAIIPVRILAN